MMVNNNLIILNNFFDSFMGMTDEQAGKLIKSLLVYHNNNEIINFDNDLIKFAFNAIKPIIDDNKKTYQDKCLKNKENISKRWNTAVYDRIPSDTKHTNIKEKNRIEKNIKEKVFIAPTIQDIENYVKEKSLNVDVKKFFNYYDVSDWVDKNGNKVKNWKQKLLANWVKDEPVKTNPCDKWENF